MEPFDWLCIWLLVDECMSFLFTFWVVFHVVVQHNQPLKNESTTQIDHLEILKKFKDIL